VSEPRLRILLASPAYWPAVAFGGPVAVARELVRRLVDRGHVVDVVTTTLRRVGEAPARGSSRALVDGATVHYLATPLRYRWMGVTPTLPFELRRLRRPDVTHVFGFRDPVTTVTAAWCRLRGIPYVFEPLGMFRPRLRKVALKRLLDTTLYRGVASGAAGVVVASPLEREDVVACGIARERVHVRGNGFPDPPPAVSSDPPPAHGVPRGAPVVLTVGRIAAGKGVEFVLEAARRLPHVHAVLVGPDDGHGTMALVRAAQTAAETRGRVHVLPPTEGPPYDLYRRADVFVLPSAGDSFGLAAAEAAAVGTPVVVTDRAGVASAFGPGEAVVVPYECESVVQAIGRVVADPELRGRLAKGAGAAARRTTWDVVTDRQEELYRRAIASR
jgi:glycosyltransferase involved in cell wall biosynthesis